MFHRLNQLTLKLVEDESSPCEWYELTASASIDIDNQIGLETCKAHQIATPASVFTAASGPLYNQYVSERFKTVV